MSILVLKMMKGVQKSKHYKKVFKIYILILIYQRIVILFQTDVWTAGCLFNRRLSHGEKKVIKTMSYLTLIKFNSMIRNVPSLTVLVANSTYLKNISPHWSYTANIAMCLLSFFLYSLQQLYSSLVLISKIISYLFY